MSLPWESVAPGGKRIAAPVCGLARNDRAQRPGAPSSQERPLIRPCGPPSPLGGEGFWGCVLQASPLRGEAVERSETDEGA